MGSYESRFAPCVRNGLEPNLDFHCYENVESILRRKVRRNKQLMSQTSTVITISDELSGDVAADILTRQHELNRDPRELLAIVMTVHNTLRELSAKARESRIQRQDRFRSRAAN